MTAPDFIIQAIEKWLKDSGQLKSGAAVLTEFLNPKATGYSVSPLPGQKVIEYYIDYGSSREYPFSIQSMESTADELTRIANSGFYEALSDYFDKQTAAGSMPTLPSGQQAVAIQALSWAYVIEQESSSTGVYQILCKLVYEQSPE